MMACIPWIGFLIALAPAKRFGMIKKSKEEENENYRRERSGKSKRRWQNWSATIAAVYRLLTR